MPALNALDEKLGEVLGLAQAARRATDAVARMAHAEPYRERLAALGEEAAEIERRTDALVGGVAGKQASIRDLARETRAAALTMMDVYLGEEDQALDGVEFLAMAEAGELCHWEIVELMAFHAGVDDVRELATWAVRVQRGHVEVVRRTALELAAEVADALEAA